MHIILFDGVCNLCTSSIQFIIKRDRTDTFKFASLQSDSGKKLIEKYKIASNIDTIIYIQNDKVYSKSKAVFQIAKQLGGVYKIFLLFSYLPNTFTDYCYSLIAKNRYTFFGKKNSCLVPTEEIKSKFLS